MIAERTLAETSAYLSELARAPGLVKVNLALLSMHAVDARRWGSAEYFAALLIFEGVARELGMTVPDPAQLAAPDRVLELGTALMKRDGVSLSKAAQRLWESLMGQKLVDLQSQG